MKTLLGWILLFGISPTFAADKPVVRWLTIDFPPHHIVTGKDAGQGIRDKFLRKLHTELPEFDHRIEYSSNSRTEALMKAGEPVCTVAKLKTPEREAFSVFSRDPFLRQLPARLVGIRTTELLKKHLIDDQVALGPLLLSGEASFGLIRARRYGDAIDRLLVTAPKNVITYYDADAALSTSLNLINRQRVDFTLGYSAELEYQRRNGTLNIEFSYVPIKEANQLVAVQVSCAKTALGQAVIDAVDQQPKNRASVREVVADYEALLPAREKQRYSAMRARGE